MAVTIDFNYRPTDRDANSYSGLIRANAYFVGRANSGNWTASIPTDDQKAAALISATRIIDSLRLAGHRFVNEHNDQLLHFPCRGVDAITGTLTSVTSTTIVTDSGLIDDTYRYTNYWRYGAIIITDGTGKGQTREISAFDGALGKITVSEAFTTGLDTTSQYKLVYRIPDKVFYALCEIAYTLIPDATSGVIDDGGQRATLQAQGVTSFSIGKFSENYGTQNGRSGGAGVIPIPPKAVEFLKGFVRTAF